MDIHSSGSGIPFDPGSHIFFQTKKILLFLFLLLIKLLFLQLRI